MIYKASLDNLAKGMTIGVTVLFAAIIIGQYGEEMKVRSRTYAIPYKNYFFQVNFTDGQIEEDCSTLFEKLLSTIKIGGKR